MSVDEMSKSIITSSNIFTNDENNPFLQSGSIVINNGLIVDVGDSDLIRRNHPDTAIENYAGGLLTPGLINLHHHLYSSLARGWNPIGETPKDFPQVLDSIWWKLDKALTLDDIYYSAIVGLTDSVKMGVTSIIDHHASENIVTGSLKMIARAYKEIGLKGSICFEITDRDGQEIFNDGLQETLSALKKWDEYNETNRLKAMIGLHASMTLSDDNLRQISEAASDYNAGYHFHLAEDVSDQNDSLKKYEIRAAERFAKFGMLNEKSLAIHGVHLSNDEIKLMRDNKTNLVTCPRSNQNNAVGVTRWWDYDQITIGLGTDGIGSDMIGEAKSALYIAHHAKDDPSFGFIDIVNILLCNNPLIFEKVTGCKVGKLSPGYPADIVYWNYDSPTPIDKNNIGGHYLYGLYNQQADTVWSDGKKIFDKGQFVNLDHAKLMAKARDSAKKLWGRI